MEPAVAGGAHAPARGLALVPAHALRHVRHAAVDRHLALLQAGAQRRVLVGGQEGGQVQVYWEGDHGPAALSVILVCQGLEEGRTVLFDILKRGYCFKN